jgi:hypothetical protein
MPAKSAIPAILMGAGGVLAVFLSQTADAWDSVLLIPYRIESDVAEYSDDGMAVSSRYYLTSFMADGREIAISHSVPGERLRSAVRTSLDRIALMLRRATLIGSHPIAQECIIPAVMTAKETILGFDTVVVESKSARERKRTWVAPRLGCFPLRVTVERRAPDAWKLPFTRSALRFVSAAPSLQACDFQGRQ